MTYQEALAKQKSPTPDPDGFWYLHRTSRPQEYPWQATDGSHRWCSSVFMEGGPKEAEVLSWPLVTEEDFSAEDWDCWEFVF
jgi:hypothetical protein